MFSSLPDRRDMAVLSVNWRHFDRGLVAYLLAVLALPVAVAFVLEVLL